MAILMKAHTGIIRLTEVSGMGRQTMEELRF